MDSALDAGPHRLSDLVARAPAEDHVALYRMCAFCRENHSGWCFAELVESEAVCPAVDLVNPMVRP